MTMSKVMVLEPQERSRKLIVDALKNQGIQVQAYDRAIDLVDEVENYTADIVLVDLEMPRLDGLKILREIRERVPEAKVLALTSHAPTTSERSRLGAFDYLTKPINRNKLISRVKGLIRQKQRRERALPLNALTGHMLPDLHDPSTGRLDARLVADYLAIPLSALSRTLGRSVAALHKSPAAASVQDALSLIASSIAVLSRMLGSKENVRVWMNSPHPDLGNRTPLSLILEGKAVAVVDMLEAVLAGQPS